MTARKTLTPLAPDEQAATPALTKKGRGWQISDKRLDALHERAREMRRNGESSSDAAAELGLRCSC